MKLFRITALVVFTLALTSLANAQASRTWVSGVGDDANPCSRTAPCKTWAGAISKTAACGEIDALDPGGFGAVTITKSITLDGTGTFASILASLVQGIIINATASDVVTIRGLSINGFCNGIRGISILQAKTVNVEDCVIFRFAGDAITGTDPDGVNLNVRNSVLRDNTGDGINVTTGTASFSKITIDNCRLSGNANGLHARSGTKVTAHNSVFSNNTTNGIFADAAGATFCSVRVWTSDISLNGGNGVRAGNVGNVGGSGVELAQNQIDFNTGNGVLISTNGIVESFTNNSIRGNGVDGCAGCAGVGPGN